MRFTETFIRKKPLELYRAKNKKKYDRLMCRFFDTPQLTSSQIESFFDWYIHTKRSFMFFDETRGVLVNHHRMINNIEFSHTLDGSELTFITTDTDNSDRKIKYTINLLKTHIKVYRYDTCTDFNKEYTGRLLKYTSFTRSTPELFNTIKDFMSFCINTRYSWCIDHEEDIHEAIPLRRFV